MIDDEKWVKGELLKWLNELMWMISVVIDKEKDVMYWVNDIEWLYCDV